jgi:hypothetical protein
MCHQGTEVRNPKRFGYYWNFIFSFGISNFYDTCTTRHMLEYFQLFLRFLSNKLGIFGYYVIPNNI